MRSATILLLLVTACGTAFPARAQQTDCKLCRETLQACLKAHTKDACNNDYTICMRHCRKKP